MTGSEKAKAGGAALTIAALGVVFGDIGTSPLYALQAVFSVDHSAIKPDTDTIYGVISMVFWSITIIVSLKYVTFIMKADNEGEGGIMALIASLQQVMVGRKKLLIALGVFGASLFYGDGMITPAISVLSAVEGLEIVSPDFSDFVVPITLGIIVVLFSIQRFGTGVVGRAFGPIMGVWFSVLAIAGLGKIVGHPEVFKALSPTYGLKFFADHFHTAFIALGAVVLTVTGAEALYADMGHFGRPPIRRAWFLFVFPALTLNYLGQAAELLEHPKSISSPFFLLFPEWSRIPVVALATVATVIASQAVISGAFSVTRQAVQLGFLPRLTIKHTSREEIGQVYAPAVNWGIFVAVVALVIGFQSSEKLASAYGIAVTGTLAIDTVLFFVVIRTKWHTSLKIVISGLCFFLFVDLAFFAGNISKIPHGGWFPLTIAAIVFTVLMTWQRGRELVTANRHEVEGSLRDFIKQIHGLDPPVNRVPGTAVFLHANNETAPLAMRNNVEHNRTLHENVVVLAIEIARVPHVPDAQRLEVDELGFADDGITHVKATYGFLDDTDVPAALHLCAQRGLERPVDLENVSYFLSRMTIEPTKNPGMARLRKRLFVGMARNAAPANEAFSLPVEAIVTMGSHIEL
ncbi:MAG: system potassium uptake protein [Solirubrobacteraceae bacterium]|nr:system potassium uptake protein [Solirubrobacteraceae bacterium]